MRYILFSTILTAVLFFGINHTANSACGGGPTVFTCDTTPPNPDPNGVQQDGNNQNLTVNVLPGAAIDTSLQAILDLDGINTKDGNDTISIEDASVIGQDKGIETFDGDDQITIINSEVKGLTDSAVDTNLDDDSITIIDSVVMAVESSDRAVDGGGGNNIISVSGSSLSSLGGDIISTTGDGNNTIHVSDSELNVTIASGDDQAIRTSAGNDTVTVERSVLLGGTTNPQAPIAVELGFGDDTFTLGTGADLRGLITGNELVTGIINCNDGFDTIIFAMDVPPDQLNRLSGEILLADPAGDTIVINNLTYTWENCELLVNELNPVLVTRPIPTLSQWGLIAMVGVLGVAGVIFYRRRRIV